MTRPKYNRDTFFHWTEIRIRFRDLDPLNHVNNALFNTYFEEARIRFLGETKEIKSELSDGKSFVLVKMTVEYLKQIQYPSTVLVGTAIGKVGNTSITAIQAIYNQQSKDLLGVAESVGVWFDIKNQRPVRLPNIENMEKMLINNED